MKRRKAITYLALSMGSTLSFPAWASGWKLDELGYKSSILSSNEEATLAEIVEIIIPETDTPGAKSLGVHQFIQKIVVDCYDKNARETFQKGFVALDEMMKKSFGKSFVESGTSQRTEILQILEKDTNNQLKNFYSLVKSLTIQGYLSSEYVMVNHMNYKLVPGKFEACVPVKNK